MRLAHFFARTPNMGDLGSALGIKTMLRSVREDVEFTEYDAGAGKVGWMQAWRIARNCVGLIVGGGGLLYNRPKHAAGFYLNISLGRYRSLDLPKCFFGVGLNAEYSGEGRWEMTNKTRESIRLFMETTDLVGVRDPESLSFLKEIGIDGAMLAPCPSMFLLHDLRIDEREATLAINVTKRMIGMGGVRVLLEHLKAYAQRAGLRPVVVAHHADEDRQCLALAAQMGMHTFLPVSPENLMQFYKRQLILVGMRGHSLIFATGASLPMLAVAYNVKCDAHMAMVGMEDYVLRPDELTDRQLVFTRLDKLLGNWDSLETHLTRKKVEFYDVVSDFARRWVSIVDSRSGI